MVDDNMYMYLILDRETGHYIGQCLTREAAMDYLETFSGADVMRSISCCQGASMDEALEMLDTVESVEKREVYAVFAAGIQSPIACFFESDHAFEYSSLRNSSGKPCTASSISLPDVDTIRSSIQRQHDIENSLTSIKPKTNLVVVALALCVIAVALYFISANLVAVL